ncbi:MAG: VUT family protein, partial [Gammaproteobacteria bacterium]|nr:VUT family protein [Gammaproteobacteria bacterium]
MPTQNRSESAYLYLSAVFVAALIAANVVSGKIITLGGLFVPAGVLAYSVTFAMTDTLCELWGRARTQTVV